MIHPSRSNFTTNISPNLQSDREKTNFAYSLKPMLIWMKILGVDLNLNERKPVRFGLSNILMLIWALFWFFNDAANYILSEIYWTQSRFGEHLGNSATILTCKTINNVNYLVHSIGIHLGLLFIAYVHWPKLWETIKKIDSEINNANKSNLHRRARRFTCINLVVLVTMLLLWIFLMTPIIYVQFEDPVYRYLAWMSTMLSYLTVSSTLVFFSTLNQVTITGLQSIRNEINELIIEVDKNVHSGSQQRIEPLLNRWKRQFILIRLYVHQLSTAFGTILVVTVAFVFVGVTTHLFFLNYGYRLLPNEIIAMLVIFVFRFVLDLWRLCGEAEKIHSQIRLIIDDLINFNFPGSMDLNRQVDSLAMFVSEFTPSIPVMHFFSLGNALMPTLAGTSLTYIIILFQFTLSESGSNPASLEGNAITDSPNIL